jgi:hypothetical protein
MDYSHILGSVFGQLTVESHVGPNDRMSCRCACGQPKEARLSHLRSGSVKSCGCLLKTVPRQVFGKHLQSQTRTYKVWDSMIRRCTLPHHAAYASYGGRGIDVCARWRDYWNFLADMGEKQDGQSLDRIDNDRGYSPDNCRWTDRHTQSRNRRTNTNLTHEGQTMTIVEWAILTGIRDTTIHERLKRGWSVHDALTRPLRGS